MLVGTSITGAEWPEQPEDIAMIEDALDYAQERGDLELVNKIEAHLWLDGPLSKSGRVGGEVRELFLDMNRIALNHPELTHEEPADPAADIVSTLTTPTLLVVGDLDYPAIIERHDELSEELANVLPDGQPDRFPDEIPNALPDRTSDVEPDGVPNATTRLPTRDPTRSPTTTSSSARSPTKSPTKCRQVGDSMPRVTW